MSDTVWEGKGMTDDEGNELLRSTNVSINRFWGGKRKDCTQITFETGGRHVYIQLTGDDFKAAAKAFSASCKETKNAWWHGMKE